jgi:hypothetical protein
MELQVTTSYPEQFTLQPCPQPQTSTISPSQLIQQGRRDHLQPGTLMGMGLGRYGSNQSPQGSTNFSAGSRRHSMLPTNCCRGRVSCSISKIVVQPFSCRPKQYRVWIKFRLTTGRNSIVLSQVELSGGAAQSVNHDCDAVSIRREDLLH